MPDLTLEEICDRMNQRNLYDRRCEALLERGVDWPLAYEIKWLHNEPLLAKFEAATPEQVEELNREFANA